MDEYSLFQTVPYVQEDDTEFDLSSIPNEEIEDDYKKPMWDQYVL